MSWHRTARAHPQSTCQAVWLMSHDAHSPAPSSVMTALFVLSKREIQSQCECDTEEIENKCSCLSQNHWNVTNSRLLFDDVSQLPAIRSSFRQMIFDRIAGHQIDLFSTGILVRFGGSKRPFVSSNENALIYSSNARVPLTQRRRRRAEKNEETREKSKRSLPPQREMAHFHR